MNKLTFVDWGAIPYSKAFEKQKELFNKAIKLKTEQKEVENMIIFCEHPHVITIGKNGSAFNLLFPEKILKEKQVELFNVDRGGDVTYHGPGQLVGYPILDLDAFHIGLKNYIFILEEIIIKLLSEYGIKGERLMGAAGVWLDAENPQKARKICAIGVKSSHFITMHGFALNIMTDLSYFSLINPCGFIDKGVTSMEVELNRRVYIEELKEKLKNIFLTQFSIQV